MADIIQRNTGLDVNDKVWDLKPKMDAFFVPEAIGKMKAPRAETEL